MRTLLCLTVVLLLTEAAASQATTVHSCYPSSYQSILRVSEQWKDGYNSGQAEKVAALYSDDAYYLTQHYITGIVHGRRNIQAYVQRGVDAHYHVDSIDTLSVDCSKDFAYAITRYQSTNAGQKALGVNIVVLKKVNNEWKIVAHEAAVPDPETAVRELDSH